jgi:arylsulfatase A-like enzyme
MSDQPNILLIQTDQQRWDALGASGNSEIVTPHLDRLAAEGIYFRQCHVQHPLCMPSRISFHTGRYPSALGITHMGVPVPPDAPLLVRNFGGAGYTCASIGKLHFLPHANREHRDLHPAYGFDHLEVSDEPGCYEDAYRAWVRQKAPEELDKISYGLPPARAEWNHALNLRDEVAHTMERSRCRAVPFAGRSDVTHSAFVAERVQSFLRRPRAKPFFCIAGFFSPHSPWIVPQEFLDQYDPDKLSAIEYPEGYAGETGQPLPDAATQRAIKHGYYAMVTEVDHYVGQLLATLEEQGLADNTIVVFTSDHGEWLGTRGRYGKDYPGDEVISRVPLLVRFPPSWGIPPRAEDGLVEAVDILPTLLEACGIQVPPAVQGRSLWPLIRAQAKGRDSVLMEAAGWKAIRAERFRYLIHADGSEHLQDLEADPHRYENLAQDPAHRDTLVAMRQALLARMVDDERPLPRTWPY